MFSKLLVSVARKYCPPVAVAILVSNSSSMFTGCFTICVPNGVRTGIKAVPRVPMPIAYKRIPNDLQSSAAVMGSISPALFSPSVNSTSTLLLMRFAPVRFPSVTSRNFSAPNDTASPIAVPSSPIAGSAGSISLSPSSNHS